MSVLTASGIRGVDMLYVCGCTQPSQKSKYLKEDSEEHRTFQKQVLFHDS